MQPLTEANENFLAGALVAVVADDATGLEVYVAAENGVANEVEVGELGAWKDERGFEFGARTEDAAFGDPIPSPKVGTRGNEAQRPKDQRAFENGTRLDARSAVNGDLVRDVKLRRHQSVEQLPDHSLGLACQIPGREPSPALQR